MSAGRFRLIDETGCKSAVIKRLKRMKQDMLEKDRNRNPFKKTFLERVRELLDLARGGSRQNWIRAKLRWFEGPEWRRDELLQELNKQVGPSLEKDYRTRESNQPDWVETAQNYSGLLGAEQMEKKKNDMDFSISLDFSVEKSPNPNEKTLSTEGSQASTKTTSELFLSMHNYLQEKEKASMLEEIEEGKQTGELITEETFAGTKLWAKSTNDLNSEKWDPQIESFQPIPISQTLENKKESREIAKSMETILGQHNPQIFSAGHVF